MSDTATTPASPVRVGSRPTETIELPSLPGSSVVVYKALLVNEEREVQKVFPNPRALDQKEQTDRTLLTLTKAIKSWNLQDEEGKELPINQDAFGLLTTADMLKCLEVVTGNQLLDANNVPLTEQEILDAKKARAAQPKK